LRTISSLDFGGLLTEKTAKTNKDHLSNLAKGEIAPWQLHQTFRLHSPGDSVGFAV